eukprot:11071386-Alexandrium_andersonii.AAC.1
MGKKGGSASASPKATAMPATPLAETQPVWSPSPLASPASGPRSGQVTPKAAPPQKPWQKLTAEALFEKFQQAAKLNGLSLDDV